MAYIGVQPTDTYLSIASQQITGTGSATYTLNYSVSNEEDVAVFVNNVRQNVSSYTVSGDQLTLGGTISASDECWVLFLGRTVGTKTPAVGSVTNDMLAGSIANDKLANSSITLNGSAVSLGGSASVVNTPSFYARASANQNLSNNTFVKLQLDTEDYDTNNDYDSSTNYRFTPSESGKYWLFGSTNVSGGAINTFAQVLIYKNGTLHRVGFHRYAGDGDIIPTVGSIVEANGTTDYFELYAKQNTGSTRNTFTDATWFGGYKLIGV